MFQRGLLALTPLGVVSRPDFGRAKLLLSRCFQAFRLGGRLARLVWEAALVLGLVGCAKSESTGLGLATGKPFKLEVLRPISGGEMILIPAGEFTMGDPQGRPDEMPHKVAVSACTMDRYLVSQELYEKVMGENPSKWRAKDNPVEQTQWTDAARFCNKCSELDGLTPCYDPETWECDFQADGYRLPTEAEWEHACRAGSRTRYFFGDDEAELPKYAWFKPRSGGRPRAVGKKRPNRWGLYDMHGNVWQWCNDYYSANYYDESTRDDPRGPTSGKQKVLRGGAWNSSAESCRAAYRFKEFPVFSDACFGSDSYGFRRVRNVPALSQAKKPLARANRSDVGEQVIEVPPEETPVVSAAPPAAVPWGKIDPSRLKGTIVFVSDRGGALDIWKMHAGGSHLRRLTDDSHPDADPRFSPDGKRIMYTSLRGGFPEVWMMNRDRSGPVRVTEGAQAAWSPDGKSIIFIRDEKAYIRELDSGDERRVTPETWERCGVPAWSPDGKQLAVASRHLGTIGIFILSVDGNKYHQLQTEDACCTPHWSGDGERIVFQTVKGHIHQVDAKNGSEEQLTFGADIQHDARYSPDGSMIVFCRAPTAEGPWQLCIADLESEDLDVVQITNKGSNRLPDWHPSEEQ